MKKCPYCGGELEENARFCLYCMRSLEKSREIPPLEKKRFPRWIFLLLLIPVLGAGAWLLFFRPAAVTEALPDAVAEILPVSSAVSRTAVPKCPDATFLYRATKAVDIEGPYENPGDEITINGVNMPTEDGVYAVPETIVGKKVVVIDEIAADNARAVYLPATVRKCCVYSLCYCPALADIYLSGKTIILPTTALCEAGRRKAVLTFHTCADFTVGDIPIRDFAASVGAQWEEWAPK